jgi:hypothetical protein
VRQAWKIMIGLTNCCPLILQNIFLDRTHKAILHSWYLNHGYLPIEYPNPGNSDISRGPIRDAIPNLYENMRMVDVRSAYLNRTCSRHLRIYDEEDPPAFTAVMEQFLRSTNQYPAQKPMLKFLAVSLVGSRGSDNNFFRREASIPRSSTGSQKNSQNTFPVFPSSPSTPIPTGTSHQSVLAGPNLTATS